MALVYREKAPITTPRGGNFVSAGEKRQNQAGQKLLPGLIASCVAGKRGTYRSVAPQSFSRASRMLFTSASAHPAGCGIRREPKSKEGAAGINPAAPKVSAAPKRLDALCAPRTAGSRRRRKHQRSVAAQSFSRVSRMLFTSASASSAVRERSSERRTRLKATDFFPSATPLPR